MFVYNVCAVRQSKHFNKSEDNFNQSRQENVKEIFPTHIIRNNININLLHFYLRNKTSVPVVYHGNKPWVRVRVRMN